MKIVNERGCVAVTDIPFYVNPTTFNMVCKELGLTQYQASTIIWCIKGGNPLRHDLLRYVMESIYKFLEGHRGSGVVLYRNKIERTTGKGIKMRDFMLTMELLSKEVGCVELDGGTMNAMRAWLCPTEKVREIVTQYLGYE